MPVVYTKEEWQKTAKQYMKQRLIRIASDVECPFCGYQWHKRSGFSGVCHICRSNGAKEISNDRSL